MKHILYICLIALLVSCSKQEAKSDSQSDKKDIELIADYSNVPLVKDGENIDISDNSGIINDSIISLKTILKELEQSIKNDPASEFNGKIYTNFRQLPDSVALKVIKNEAYTYPLHKLHISKNGWEGEIKLIFDSDKLSYRAHGGEVLYYEFARKIVVNLKNTLSNKSYNFEITRENVKLAENEEYNMFDLFNFYIKCIDPNQLVISTVITFPDSDVGDLIYATCTKSGEITINNHPIVLDEE